MTPPEQTENPDQTTKIIETNHVKLLVELRSEEREEIVEILRYPSNYCL